MKQTLIYQDLDFQKWRCRINGWESASHLIAILICLFPFGYYDFLILQCCTYGIFEVPNEQKVFTTDTGIHILTYLLKSYKLKSTWGPWGAEKKLWMLFKGLHIWQVAILTQMNALPLLSLDLIFVNNFLTKQNSI